MISMSERRLYLGAEIISGGGVHFRVWAPRRRKVDLILTGGPGSSPAGSEARTFPLEPEGNGFYSVHVAEAEHGTLYRYRLDNETVSYPDPVSRFQPEGPHEHSQVVDPG